MRTSDVSCQCWDTYLLCGIRSNTRRRYEPRFIIFAPTGYHTLELWGSEGHVTAGRC